MYYHYCADDLGSSAASRHGPTRAARPPSLAGNEAGVDWRADWRAGPQAQALPRSPSLGKDLHRVFPHLPPPGNTQSTSWSSRQHAEDSLSRHSQATRQDWKERYLYRPVSNGHRQTPPPLHHDSRGARLDDDDLYLYDDPSSSRHGHWANSSHPFAHDQPPPRGVDNVFPFRMTESRPVTHAHEPLSERGASLAAAGWPALQSEVHRQPAEFDTGRWAQDGSRLPPDRRQPNLAGHDPISPDFEDEMQDFWKRHDRPRASTPFPPRSDHLIASYAETHPDVGAPPSGRFGSHRFDSLMTPVFGHPQQHSYRHVEVPGPHQSPVQGPSFRPPPQLTPRPAIPIPSYPSSSLPPSSSIIKPYRPSPSMPTVHEHEREAAEQAMEMGQHGTTTDEWKHLWSSRKAYR